jgi:hypothetical protein
MTLTGPVCDAGRCAQVLAAFAGVRARQPEQLASVLTTVRDDARLGLDERQRGVWADVVGDAIRKLTGGESP